MKYQKGIGNMRNAPSAPNVDVSTQTGLPMLLSIVTLLFVIGLIVFVFSIMGGSVNEATLIPLTPTPQIEWTSGLNTSQTNYFKLEETSGTTAIDSLGLANATLYNGVVVNVAGKLNQAYYFDGTNDYIRTSNSFTGDRSASFWFNSVNTNKAGLMEWGDYCDAPNTLSLESGKMHFRGQFNDNTNASLTFNNNTWYHVVVTYNATSQVVTIYVNGEFFSSEAQSNVGWIDGATTFGYGVSSVCSVPAYPYLNGTIDEIALYDRVLSSTEAYYFYNNGNALPLYYTAPAQPTSQQSQAGIVITDTTTSISGTTTWFPIIVVISAMVVLILLTVLIIRAIRESGFVGGGTA